MTAAHARGLKREREVARREAAAGWVVGSRRHIPGPGDLLLVRPGPVDGLFAGQPELRLVEVKGTRRPFSDFLPHHRAALAQLAASIGADAYLYHWPKGAGDWTELHERTWP